MNQVRTEYIKIDKEYLKKIRALEPKRGRYKGIITTKTKGFSKWVMRLLD